MGLEELAYHLLEKEGDAFGQFLVLAEALKQDRYGPTFLMGLGIAYDFFRNPIFAQQMMFLGGYGVLGHMIGQEGLDVVRLWRGSHDLDVLCASLPAAQFLHTNSAVESRSSPNLPDKRTFELRDSYLDELCGKEGVACKADVYPPLRQLKQIRVGNTQFSPSDVSAAAEVPIFGVPFRIARLSDSLRMKLDITTGDNVPRGRDIIDIFNLLGVAERQKMGPEVLLKQLSPEQRNYLMKVFKHGDGQRRHMHTLTPPTPQYIRAVYGAYKDTGAPSLELRAF